MEFSKSNILSMLKIYRNIGFRHFLFVKICFFSFHLNAQNCLNSENVSFIDSCGNCVFETDSLLNTCHDLEQVCSGDTLSLYIDNSLALIVSDSLPEIIRNQIEVDFCADGGNIIDCYCTLLPELESFVIEHSFSQNNQENQSSLLDLLSYEDDYLRLIIAINDSTQTGILNYEINLEREVIMNCYLCNDLVCIDQNIGIPIEESSTFQFNVSNECVTESVVPTNQEELEIFEINIYPNPAIEFIMLPNKYQNTEISIFDIEGKLLLKTHNSTKIDVSNLSKGLYFLNLQTNTQMFQSQFIKL